MRFSETKGRKVVATASADTVGQVRELLVDPATRSVVAFRLKKYDHGEVLRWGALTAVGVDAITVADTGALTGLDADLEPLSGKSRRMVKKRVLSTAGVDLGVVGDVTFDPASGRLSTIVLKDDTEIDASRLVGIGSYAVVVQRGPGEG